MCDKVIVPSSLTTAVVFGIPAPDHAVTKSVASVASAKFNVYGPAKVETPGEVICTLPTYGPDVKSGAVLVPVIVVAPVAER